MSEVYVDIIGGDEIIKRYEELSYRTTPPMLTAWLIKSAHPFLRMRAAARFQSEGDDASGKWADLALNTGMIRRNLGFNAYHPINVRSQRLMWFVLTSFKMASTAQTATLTMPGKGNALMLSKLRIAQQGGVARKGKGRSRVGPNRPAPPRPVVALSYVDEEALNTSLREWLIR